MERNDSGKQSLWIYGAILFTSALIILLITALSQIRLNKSLLDYETNLRSKEEERRIYASNIDSLIKMNEELKEELSALKKKSEEMENSIKEESSQRERLIDILKETGNSYESLLEAEMSYRKGEIVEAALALYERCKVEYLSGEGARLYGELKDKTFLKAAETLYREGYGYYRDGRYDDAIRQFSLSVSLTDNAYFSDDCLYFTAWSYYKKGEFSQAVDAIERLMAKYPGTTYKKHAEALKSMMETT